MVILGLSSKLGELLRIVVLHLKVQILFGYYIIRIFFTYIESTLFTSIPSTPGRFSFCNFLCKILTGGCHMNDNGEILLEYSIYPKTGEIQ